jgi:hypothetical protein
MYIISSVLKMCKKILSTGLYCKRADVAFGFCKTHIPSDINFECCICYCKSNCHNTLNCNHCICGQCLYKLRNDTCPVCRLKLEGRRVGDKLLRIIKKNREEDKKIRESHLSIGDVEFLPLLILESMDEFIIDEFDNRLVIFSSV